MKGRGHLISHAMTLQYGDSLCYVTSMWRCDTSRWRRSYMRLKLQPGYMWNHRITADVFLGTLTWGTESVQMLCYHVEPWACSFSLPTSNSLSYMN